MDFAYTIAWSNGTATVGRFDAGCRADAEKRVMAQAAQEQQERIDLSPRYVGFRPIAVVVATVGETNGEDVVRRY